MNAASIQPGSGKRSRVRIYQMLPRLFGNTNETRKPNGMLIENGVGKFNDINEAALTEIQRLGCTHVWLTGILQQASSTDYSAIGEPRDDPDLLKGLAGSPFAITDYFDVCPDYAANPAERIAEFRQLIARIHGAGLKAVIDFVPNHVARGYHSTVFPELCFGVNDDRRKFFDPANSFFYLQSDSPGGGPPLRLPTFRDGIPVSATCGVLGGCDGRFGGELEFGRVTGNNVVSWAPGISDWYETAKLNYGYDFTAGTREYPHGNELGKPIPDTWTKMDCVLAYWQELGADGFRCDMAHMVPPEFWAWVIERARARDAGVFFAAEAYDNDPAKVPGCGPVFGARRDGQNSVKCDLLTAGFDAVYDDPSYKTLKWIYEGSKWANDLDAVCGDEFLCRRSLRYAENHDEVRLAGKGQWGDAGMEVGRPVSAILFGMSVGPILLHSGQEVGEPAEGAEGFGGDDARTTIFDYWSMPELAKWVNGHRYDGGRLSSAQKELRAFYARLLRLADAPAFRDGAFFGLNGANNQNPAFGRLPGEDASGRWLYAFLRFDAKSGQRFLVVANLHPSEKMQEVRIAIPAGTVSALRIDRAAALSLTDRLSGVPAFVKAGDSFESAGICVELASLPPLTPCYFEMHIAANSSAFA